MIDPNFGPLVERLRAAHADILELTQGQADAVVDPATGFVTLFADAHGALFNRQKRFQSLYEVVACGVLVCAPNGLVEYANDAFCKSIGTTFLEIEGRQWFDLAAEVLDHDGEPCLPEDMPDRVVLQQEEAVRNAVLGVRLEKLDETRWFLAHANRLIDPFSGAVTGSLLSWVEITELRLLERQRIQAAVVEERQRVARDLHDSLGNRLAAMKWQFEAVSFNLDHYAPGELAAAITDLKSQAEESLRDARRAVWDLSLPLAEAQPLAIALRAAIESTLRGTGLDLQFEVSGSVQPVRPEIATMCIFVTQEAIGNAMKHSGARHLDVQIQFTETNVIVLVQDDGHGFDTALARKPTIDSGFGLKNMRDRAVKARGELTLESDSSGTSLRLVVPL